VQLTQVADTTEYLNSFSALENHGNKHFMATVVSCHTADKCSAAAEVGDLATAKWAEK